MQHSSSQKVKRILIVDDDPNYNNLMGSLLAKNGYDISQSFDPKLALTKVSDESFDLVLVDYQLPSINGLEFIEIVKKKCPHLPLILVTNYNDIRVAVNSIKLGAFEFVSKPIQPDELLRIVAKATEPKSPNHSFEKQTSDVKNEIIVGESAVAKQLWEYVQIVAPTKMNVLIRGESGTGKEHVARALHAMSRRKENPFVAVDCGAIASTVSISEFFGHMKGSFTGATEDRIGLFEQADGGTLFLDELGNLPFELQTNLLRAIQEGTFKKLGSNHESKVDVRIIAATNGELILDSDTGKFRADLFHRINEFELLLPPLRERVQDLELLSAAFIKRACVEMEKPMLGISAEVWEIFQKYSWPGNIRELKNIIRRAVLLTSGNEIKASVLPHEMQISERENPHKKNKAPNSIDFKEAQLSNEKSLIQQALELHKFNKSKTAKALGIDRSTLYKKIKEYDLDA